MPIDMSAIAIKELTDKMYISLISLESNSTFNLKKKGEQGKKIERGSEGNDDVQELFRSVLKVTWS